MTYLLDANTFIEAKNRYYGMEICPGYWDWLLHTNNQGHVSSITAVKNELRKGDDELSQWAHDNEHLFFPEDDEATQIAFAEIANHIMLLDSFNLAAREDFLSGADPWLIAKAKAIDATIVTHEKLNKNIKRKILIPNVCEDFGVTYINTFELLSILKAQFIMKN